MRIAVFTDADFDRATGTTTMLSALLRHAPPDIRPRIYTFSDLEVDEPDFLAVRSPAFRLPFASEWPLHVPRVRALERRLAADDVRAIHLSTPGAAGLAARYLARQTGLPLVGSLPASCLRALAGARPGAWRHTAAVMPRYLRWLYSACSTVLVPSADAIRCLTRAGWDADRLVVWPGAADAAAFSPARRSQGLRNEWHVSERRPAILCVGRVDGDRGHDLIEPLGSLLHGRGMAHRFIVVGEGPGLRALREACPDAVCAGWLSRRDLATVMASADLFLWPGEVGTQGLVLLEAQASGLPVVVTSDGAALEHMRPGVSGVACRAGDVLGFATQVSALLSDPARRRAMGEAGRRLALSRAWPAGLERVYELYRAAGRSDAASARSIPVHAPVHTARAQR